MNLAPLYFLLTSVLILTQSCVSAKKGEEMNNDIFSLQTRLLELEHNAKESIKTTDQSSKKQNATVQSEVDRLKVDIQRINGDLDALKIGVATGQLPGTDPDGPSIAQSLNSIQSRLEVIEANQAELLESMEKANQKNEKTVEKKSSSLDSIESLKGAFEKKKYAQVTENAAAVIKKSKSKDVQEEANFLYGESLFKLGKLRDAALKYNEFVDTYPNSSRLALVKMRMGDCFKNLGDKATAKLYYQELVSKYPTSEHTAKAKQRLSEIDGSGGGAAVESKSEDKGASLKKKTAIEKLAGKEKGPKAKGKVAKSANPSRERSKPLH
jgi:TolA-binding protein